MIRFFANHPTAANILMLVFFICGLAVLPTMKRETMPEIDKFEVQVKVPYPAASASDVEEGICQTLEDATDGISFMDEKRCESKDNVGVMVLKMLEHGDMPQFIDDVKLAVDAIDDLPEDAETPVVKELGRTQPVISVAISAQVDRPTLKRLAEDYKHQLLQLPDVPIVKIKGFSTHQLKISVPDYNLRRFGLSINDIANLVGHQNVDLPAGDIQSDAGNHQIRFTDQRHTPAELEQLIVLSGEAGAEVRLGDIATITDGFEYKEDKIDFNGNTAAILEIHKNTLDDSLQVFNTVQQFVDEENKRLPEGTRLELTQDLASIVAERLQLIIKNAWQGLLLVIFALYLFFSPRYTFWVAMGLPVSFLGGFLLFTYFGVTINVLSLVGLLIAIGILMDDAIVICESIATEHRNGKSPLNAAVDGTKRVARGVLSSFVTTMFIFSGLLMLKGDLGQVLRAVPIVLICVLIVSLIEAFLILPHHLKQALEHSEHNHDKIPRWKTRFTETFERWRESVGRLADNAVNYRYAVAGATIALFIVSVSMLANGVLKFKAFPDLDGDIIQARILLPQGTALARTEEVVATVITGLKATDEQLLNSVEDTSLIRNINITYNLNADAFESGEHIATISVDLRSAQERNSNLETFKRIWRDKVGELPDVIAIQYKQPAFGPAGRALEIRLTSNNLQELSTASNTLQNWLNGYPGVVDVMDDLRPGKPQITVQMKPGALTAGIDAQTIASQLRAAYQGVKIDDLQHENEDYEVQVMLDEQSKNSLTDFDYMVIIHSQTKQAVPINAIAQVSENRSFARINRVDNLRAIIVFGDVDTDLANTNEIITDTTSRFLPQLAERFPGVNVSFEGEIKNANITSQSLSKALLLGAIGIFLLLSLQFRNYFEPIIVMIAIPLSFIGVIWGHIIMGLDLTMPSMLGFVSLAGIVVNDSILLVEFVKLNAKNGMSVHTAASQATRDRFRAIFLTSFTTVAGVCPLMFETSLQAQVLIPLVTSIAFGIIASTMLILIVLPVLYAILEDFGFTETEEADTTLGVST